MRNRAIDAYRFLFSVVITYYHYRTQISDTFLTSGYQVVEFFFILSGFLMATASQQPKYTELPLCKAHMTYMNGRIKRLWPHYLLSLCCFYAVAIFFTGRWTLEKLLRWQLPEIFMLHMTGLSNPKYVGMGADWYVGSLIVASFLLFLPCLRWKRIFQTYVAPILSVSIYVCLWREYGHLGAIRGDLLNTYSGTLRAIAAMCLGCILHGVYCYLREHYTRRTAKPARVFFTLVEVACVAAACISFGGQRKTERDYLMVLVFAIIILFAFLKLGYLSEMLDNGFSAYLSKISYAIFLNHMAFKEAFSVIHGPTTLKAICYGVCVIAFSMLTTALMDAATKKKPVSKVFHLLFVPKKIEKESA